MTPQDAFERVQCAVQLLSCCFGAVEVCEDDRPAKGSCVHRQAQHSSVALFAFRVLMEMEHTGLSLTPQALFVG